MPRPGRSWRAQPAPGTSVPRARRPWSGPGRFCGPAHGTRKHGFAFPGLWLRFSFHFVPMFGCAAVVELMLRECPFLDTPAHRFYSKCSSPEYLRVSICFRGLGRMGLGTRRATMLFEIRELEAHTVDFEEH